MSLEIRIATDDELDAVGRLTVAAYVEDGFLDDGDDYVAHLADAPERAREAELWVAAEGDDVVGTVTFCPEGSTFTELAGSGEAEFRMLAVSPRARGRGIARALVQTCIDRSAAHGYGALVLCSMREMVTAHRLYERLGFRRTPPLDWSPAPGVQLIAYRLELS